MLVGLAQGRASALLWLPVLVGLVVVEMEMAGAAESQESNTAGTESPVGPAMVQLIAEHSSSILASVIHCDA